CFAMGKRSPYRGRDRFTTAAKQAGYPARSVFKLEEIDQKIPLVRKGGRYLDCGCRPGSWSVWIRRVAGADAALLGIDVEPCEGYPGTFLQLSVEDLTPDMVREHLGGPPDVVLSDMAPNTTGDRFGDHVRQIAIARRALEVATQTLAPGGAFVCKVFEGEDAPGFVDDVRKLFTTTKRIRPEAVRRESVELFVLGMGYRPA
ncbi:MAG: RlmE family RNA methyltransferase, partial [Myxococcales bacterium]|nr:RlmE family RNA methyltransferase [Myxococcales bacterium]